MRRMWNKAKLIKLIKEYSQQLTPSELKKVLTGDRFISVDDDITGKKLEVGFDFTDSELFLDFAQPHIDIESFSGTLSPTEYTTLKNNKYAYIRLLISQEYNKWIILRRLDERDGYLNYLGIMQVYDEDGKEIYCLKVNETGDTKSYSVKVLKLNVDKSSGTLSDSDDRLPSSKLVKKELVALKSKYVLNFGSIGTGKTRQDITDLFNGVRNSCGMGWVKFSNEESPTGNNTTYEIYVNAPIPETPYAMIMAINASTGDVYISVTSGGVFQPWKKLAFVS